MEPKPHFCHEKKLSSLWEKMCIMDDDNEYEWNENK